MTRFYRLPGHRSILFFLNDKPKYRIQHACNNQFITGIFPLHFFKEDTDNKGQLFIILIEVIADVERMIKQVIDITGFIVGLMKHFGRFKYETFICCIIRIDDTSVDDAIADKDNIPRNEMQCLLIE